ncbi:hypothetical protein MUN88_14220 [Gracilibacillus caseinilyticus]|uniref:Uncharacterized protein n=1 Tax=Gracilibacillus caseinilyticus TaxID=2932256 RepID=A0ABY4ETL3_9BACI|nr:hypothetical protein [Gracilibacillus caseinilyticus]UOQ47223.1 hypothetical protein MUN88_14220 [Gracilibacillus caseinilyticus]
MDNDLMQSVIEVVFMGHMKYVAPFLLLMMSTLFVDQIINLVKGILANNKRVRY